MSAPTLIADRYEILSPLGGGGSAEVFRVKDRVTNTFLALKLMKQRQRASEETLLGAFLREFRVLTGLRHPHLLRVHDFGTHPQADGARAWFTMDLVDGRPVDQSLPRLPDWGVFARAFDAVADALGAIHEKGLLHGDITSSNILVGSDPSAIPPPVWLMDLGLAELTGRSYEGAVRGTVATVAPELLKGGAVDARADLYSLGCVMYRVVTGQDPFVAATPWEVLRAHVSTPPTQPRQLNPELPASLDRLILDLLAKSPADRPSSAREVRQSLAPFSGRDIGGIVGLLRPLAPALAGREREILLFGDLLRELEATRGNTLLLTGTAGSGRTRLLEEFRLQARLAGFRTTLIRPSNVARTPFSVIDLARADLTQGTDSPAAPLPALTRLDRFSALLEGGVVLLVDDLLDADSASIEVIRALVARRAEAGWPLLLALVIDGAAEAAWTEVLLERGEARVLRLKPLEPAAVGQMAASMFGRAQLSRDWSDWIFGASGGVPELVEAAVSDIFSSGAVQRDPEMLRRPESAAEGRQLASRRSQSWLEDQWRDLSDAEKSVLNVLAVADGDPVRWSDLSSLDPLSVPDATSIATLLERGLARRGCDNEGDLALSLSARSLASTITSWLPRAALQAMHERLALTLADRPGSEAVCAAHLAVAGEHERALPLWLAAAERALEERLPKEALRLTDQAMAARLVASPTAASLQRVRALALAAAGHTAEADSAFTEATRLARASGTQDQLAAILLAAGSFRGERGNISLGLAALEESLSLRDDLGDVAGGARVLIAMGELLERADRVDEAEARWVSALSQARRARDQEIEADALLALGEHFAAAGQHDRAAEQFRAAEALLLDSGSRRTRHAVRRGKALALAATRRWREALEDADAALEEARHSADREAESEALVLSGRFAAALGKRRDAVRRLEEAQALQLRLGLTAEAVHTAALIVIVQLERGQPRAALARGRDALQWADRLPPSAARQHAVLALATVEASLGHVDAASMLAAVSGDRPIPPHEKSARLLIAGLARLRAGDPETARGHLQEACFLARRQAQNVLETDGLLLLAEAYLDVRDEERALLALRRVRQIAESTGDAELLARVRLLLAERELLRSEGDLVAAADDADAAAHTLLERERTIELWRVYAAAASAAQRLGQTERSRRSSQEATRWLEALLSATPEADRARLRNDRRALPFLSDRSSVTATLPESVPVDRGLVARSSAQERLLEINRSLNSTLDLHSQLQILLDTAIELTGAERGFVLLQEGQSEAVELARGVGGADLVGSDREFSRGIARQVMQDGQPLVTIDAQTDERLTASTSIHSLKICAVLATPLRVRGVIAGALTLDSRQAGAPFDASALDLLLSLSDQAGIALANSRLVEQLKRQSEEISRLNERLSMTVEEQRIEILEKQSNLEIRYRYDSLLGASPPMQKVYRALDKIIPTEIPVLVTGESGTGKDLVACVLHYNGPRSKERFVTVNCAALTDTLLESELFGHRRGSFTGADRDRKGLFEQADKGTLFLDEIGEMPLALQPKLLRAIQFGEVRRVGEDVPRHVDVRIIAATHRDLSEQIKAGRFREDLMYRLDVARIHVTPLRDRLEDLGLLVDHFLERHAEKSHKPRKQIEPAALRLFLRHQWPGNVRELENEVIKLAAFCEGDVITEVDLLENASFLERAKRVSSPQAVGDLATLEAAEIDQIRQALRTAQGNRTKAAETLGIDRSTLYRKLKKLGED